MSKMMLSFTALTLLTTSGWATNPCAPIAGACMKVGYYKGGNTVGKGLIDDCMMPIVTKQKTLPDVSFDDNSLVACKATLIAALKQYTPNQK